ncbi:histone-lysine N-methyltransferase SETMAR-like [Drosophila kikkawai]|uniref:Histone-lysine N-methyltransferase SETMAR-like n=1 Tax=Drosophila kikkawai TaxID=30033 RepID=A0ABM4GFU4_DROKI
MLQVTKEVITPMALRNIYSLFEHGLYPYPVEDLSDCLPAQRKSTIKDWYNEFKRGRVDTEDVDPSGSPKTAVTPENIAKIRKMVLAERKLKLKEIANASKISEGSVLAIFHEHLDMRKLCSKWVPRLLTPDQKQQRIDDSETFLSMMKRNGTDFFRRYVDEWTKHGYTTILQNPVNSLLNYLEKGKTINSEYYIKLQDRLDPAIKKKRPHMAKKKPLFHWIMHRATNLAPSDYWLFSDHKKHVQGKRYRKNEEAIADTEAYFEGKSSAFYKNGIER